MRKSTEIAEILEEYLKTKKISLRQFSSLIDISHTTIVSWKKKEVYPSIEFISKIASFMNVSLDWLVNGDVMELPEIIENEKKNKYIANQRILEIKNDLHNCFEKALNQLDILTDENLALRKENEKLRTELSQVKIRQ